VESGSEQALDGGNVAGAVVRVGGTVRKPAGPWVEALRNLDAWRRVLTGKVRD